MNEEKEFLDEIRAITNNYDGDCNGLCGESDESIIEILAKDYPFLFKAYLFFKKK